MALPGISLAVVGPKGSGKTTAVSSLCQQLEAYPAERIAEVRSLAKDMGRPQGACNWMLDKLRSERERGCSIMNSMASFKSQAFSYTAMDTPGDVGYMKTLLSVTSLADIAVVCVPAPVGEFEEHVDSNRLRELVLACFTMGIKQVAVWVTKIDDVSVADKSEARFQEITKLISTYIKEVGFKQKDVPFVPVCGLRGDNLATKASSPGWYTGKSAVEALDALGPIPRPADKPLRLPVLEVFEKEDVGTIVVGRVETGSVRDGIKMMFSPGGWCGKVESIHKDGKEVSEAKGGDIISVAFGDSISCQDLQRGMVGGFVTEDPAVDVETFVAQVVVLDHPGAIRAGYCPAIAIHTAQVPCEFEELISLLDRKTKEEKANPEKAKTGEVVTVRLRPRAPVCVEAFGVYPSLGRFAVRDHGRTIGVGVVKEVVKRAAPKPRTSGENEY
jgi:elongation factor 1-alpha